jgi:hypothetical protein
LVTIAVLVVAGCSSSGSSAGSATTSIPPAEVSHQASATNPSSAPPEPTGVPGLDADDPFCAAWAGYVGTVQALGIAASFGDLPSTRFAATELTAAPRLVEVTAAIDASWPAELAAERDIVIEQRIGPYSRRAARGVEALVVAGVTATDQSTLSTAWQTALQRRDPEVPVIELPAIAGDLQAKVDAAAAAYDAAVTPFAQDPSLAVDGVDNPATDAYLAVHCPDLVSSGVGDAL